MKKKKVIVPIGESLKDRIKRRVREIIGDLDDLPIEKLSWEKRNKERKRLYNQKYQIDNRIRIRENWRKSYERNRDKMLQRNRVYYSRNREALLKKSREFYSLNSKKIRERVRKRRERRKENELSRI